MDRVGFDLRHRVRRRRDPAPLPSPPWRDCGTDPAARRDNAGPHRAAAEPPDNFHNQMDYTIKEPATSKCVHPAAGLFPTIPEAELDTLADDSAQHGLMQP